MTSWALSRVPVKPLYNTSFKISISPLSSLYLQKVLLIHLKKYLFYISYKSKLSLCVSFKERLCGLSLLLKSRSNGHGSTITSSLCMQSDILI